MGRIKKAGGPKHDATLSSAFADFIAAGGSVSLADLAGHLEGFPSSWPFPRGDLYHWIPLLNRFDHVLEVFNEQYRLKDGPQTQPFGRKVLLLAFEDGPSMPVTEEELDRRGFAEDGDRHLVEAILVFSRMLLQNCGNRSLYSSSDHLNSLLNTTSLPLLHHTLRLAVCLAQRYHTSRQRPVSSMQQINAALLASHYNINLENMQKLSVPFTRPTALAELAPGPAAGTPSGKGKERAWSADRIGAGTRMHANDLAAIARRDPPPPTSREAVEPDGASSAPNGAARPDWKDWGDVLVTYYPTQEAPPPEAPRDHAQPAGLGPDAARAAKPAPARKASGLSPQTPRRKSNAAAEAAPTGSTPAAADEKDELLQEHRFGAMRALAIGADLVRSTPLWKVMASVPADVPQETRYELLSRLRVAWALAASLETRQQILGIRILAITNLAYIYPEATFQQKVLQQDTDEPRRLQLAHQLAELVHPSEGHDDGPPRWLQTLALGALEALAKFRTKMADVATALNVNVNHGVLFYLIRKAIVEMSRGGEDDDDDEHDDDRAHGSAEQEEWRDALFSLLAYLPNFARAGGALVSAGLLPVLLDVLTLRSDPAERVHTKVIDFLSVFIYDMRDPFQTLANVSGLNIIADLVAYEVESGHERALKGQGMPVAMRNQFVDYDIPFFQHQTLRRLFKFINHMMSQNGLTLDRLLRNLIDSPQLLGGLRTVMGNAKIFGSSVWSGAVDVMSNFIHNEPTSYAVIAESGLSKAFLEAVRGKPIDPAEDERDEDVHSDDSADDEDSSEDLLAEDLLAESASQDPPPQEPMASGPAHAETGPTAEEAAPPAAAAAEPLELAILPATDAIAAVAPAFGAICLNSAGMRLFRRSKALPSFFEIFRSPEHVQRMHNDIELPNMLGNSIDELVRHHPQLKRDVIDSVITMVKAVCRLCRERVESEDDASRHDRARPVASGAPSSLANGPRPTESGDVEMGDADGDAPQQPESAESTELTETNNKSATGAQGPSVSAFVDVLAKFLVGFFSNSSACSIFIERGGAEWLLDFAVLPSLPHDFSNQSAGQSLSRVVHKLVEQKPHLVLPSLVRMTQVAADDLTELLEGGGDAVVLTSAAARKGKGVDRADPTVESPALFSESNAHELVGRLTAVHTLCNILVDAYAQHHLNHRSSQNLFTQVNLADLYKRLVETMGRLHRWCVIRQILLQKDVPPAWNDPSYVKNRGLVIDELDEMLGMLHSQRRSRSPGDTSTRSEHASAAERPAQWANEDGTEGRVAHVQITRFETFRKLRSLLSHLPPTIVIFFHQLGKTLVTKRAPDSYQRHNSTMVAETIADAMMDHLRLDLPDTLRDEDERISYWNVELTSLLRLMFEVSLDRPPAQCLTVLLLAFKSRGGFDAVTRLLDYFVQASQPSQPEQEHGPQRTDASRRVKANNGIEAILAFFLHATTPKNILDATQTGAMASRPRDKDKPDYFSAHQFLVELKLAVLPPVQALLEPDFIERASLLTVKKVVEILRCIFESDNEQFAIRRAENATRRLPSPPKAWKESADQIEKLVNAGYPEDLAREALFRCSDNPGLAEEYCALRDRCSQVNRLPLPDQKGTQPVARSQARTPVPGAGPVPPPPPPEATGSDANNASIGDAPPERDESASHERVSMDVDVADAPDQTETSQPSAPRTPDNDVDDQSAQGGALLTMSIDNLLGNLTELSTPVTVRQHARVDDDGQRDEPMASSGSEHENKGRSRVATLDDLDEKREAIRRKIIDLALDILNVQGDVTFELADLIIGSVPKSAGSDAIRAEIGETLVQSLMSLQMEDDFRPVGKKIAAYAHLLALILQNKPFYDATLKELTSSLSPLLGFIKVFPDQSLEESSPWISRVLLIFEKLLSDDAQPPVVKWTLPTSSTPAAAAAAAAAGDAGPTIEAAEPVVSHEHKSELFAALLKVLPRVGRDATLALSVVRILVILTRNRQLAARMGERSSLQRLFVMVKQLAGMTSGRLTSAFMMLLRHIIEDEDTTKHILRHAIRTQFDQRQVGRPVDTSAYMRGLSHHALRAPDLFVEVSKEMVKIPKFDPNRGHQILVLKESPEGDGAKNVGGNEQDPARQGEPDKEGDKAAPANDSKPSEQSATSKLDYPNGVIYHLLWELFSYKEVEDKEPPAPVRDARANEPEQSRRDVEMTDRDSGAAVTASTAHGSSSTAPGEKSEPSRTHSFKPAEHPIFIYRCFILQCLTELLGAYTRTKLEFVNFTRKAPPPAPSSKPRSGILNYFFHDLIPIGTLSQPDDIAFRKRYSTSNWATATIVALCSQPDYKSGGRPQTTLDDLNEPELNLVQKFVLDQGMKAYRDATASSDSLDVKYAKILSLADVFHRMLLGATNAGMDPHTSALYLTQRDLAKMMLEKNLISSLTISIAEIDLNYPSAKRAVKYILRPLKVLTQAAVELNDSPSLSSFTGQTEEEEDEEEEIPSATSVSEAENGREETPDLFRNSTLGLFEPGREADSSSDTSHGDDEEFYDEEEYGDEMEYEEEGSDDEDGLSDDDEISDMEGLPGEVGLDVEVVLDEGTGDAGTDLDETDDDEDEGESADEAEDPDGMDRDGNGEHEEGDDNDEWESEDDDDPDYDTGPAGEDAHMPSHVHEHGHHENPLEHIVRALGGRDDEGLLEQLGAGDLGMELDPDGYMDDDMQEEEDISEDEDEDDEMDEDEDVMYGPGYDDGDVEPPSLPWGWSHDADEPISIRGHSHSHHHHHHHHHRLDGPWSTFSSSLRDPVPTYRPTRSLGASSRGGDEGSHPLLQRGPDAMGGSLGRDERDDLISDWMQALEFGGRGRGISSSDIPTSLISNLINVIGNSVIGNSGAALGGLHRHGGALHFHVTGPPPRLLPRDTTSPFGIRRSAHASSAQIFTDPAQAISFSPVNTFARWYGEARLLFGPDFADRSTRLINALLSVMVPPALEEERVRKDEAAAEDARRVEKLKEEQAELERQELQKLKEADEREAQAAQGEGAESGDTRDESPAESPEGPTDTSDAQQSEGEAEPQESSAGGAMEGVEATRPEGGTEAPAPEPGPESGPSAARVRTTIRGRELDITGMDIDPEYLDALPEELREEVLMHQIAERRSQAASTGEQPTNISREFLEALPAEIRQELLEQEAQDRRRREREEARRRAAASSGAVPAAAEDMDPASVLATLEPRLREAILMEQDEEMLAQLPQEIAEEARALGSEHRLRHRITDPGRISRTQDTNEGNIVRVELPKTLLRKTVGQVLDKAGIATLLRLMFIPQQGSARHTLTGILRDVCENKQNRIETVGLLLSILQDGSADTAAIERSFAQLSVRARQAGPLRSGSTPKRPTDQAPPAICDVSPLAVVQQCLNTLVLLVQYNPHLPTFFLTEHESSAGLKRSASKKGKMKENRASRYALNSLLGMLDRKLVMESPTVMEQLAALLYSVTQPLNMLLRKNKEHAAAEPASTDETAPEAAAALVEASGEAPAVSGPSDDAQAQEISASPAAEAQAPQAADQDQSLAAGANATASTSKPTEEDQHAEGAKQKKERTLSTPIVPDYNLRLVVNILTARECSAKTFRDTLSTINNLSAIPGSKEVFGDELLRQARSLGQSILEDLNDLIGQITKARTDTDVQGVALVKFSPSSSSQAKLLRVLTALDYLFDAQRDTGKSNDKKKDGGDEASATPKDADILATLATDGTFGALWAKLSECLGAIRQKEPSMVNLATILLPLIESLMVVCKNTTLKTSTNQKMVGVEASLSSLAKDSKPDDLEDLFFKFTEEHRKVLNELVRHNPKLMSGTFSLLVKNPKVLEFDNKRNYFTRRLHTRGTEARHTQAPLQLSVRRDHVFLDSFKSLYFKSGEEMKYGKLSIRFHGEEGVDAGGVTREWFQVLSRQMFNPDYALFTPVAADRTTFHPNRLSAVNPEHLMFFKFIGRIIGKALYEGRVLDCHFSRAVYKRILGKPVSVKDMETLDLDYYKSLVWMLENDITDIITETFSVETEAFGETQIVDLKPNGRNIPVTEQSKQEYVQLVVRYRLTGSVHEQLEQFLNGFHDIVPAELISIFNEQELELLISGLPEIDVDDWKNNTEYHNYTASSPQIQWFWRAVRSFDKEERAKLLQFVTGTSKVPLNGFKELEGMNGFSRFNIHRDYGSKERLPSSHTCFNQLDLPEYDSYESLRSHVYTAMTAGSEYFGFA